MPLRALQDRLAEAGQWLALDPPTQPDGATLGGLLSTGESGPRRLRHGALRDLVIGVTLVLPDGTVAHAGGHVIKNVAGYDLSKLMYGPLGTLGLIAEVVLRLHPRPETSATVVVPSSVQEATARSLDLLASPLEPSAVDWVGDPRGGGSTGRLAVRFEGTAAGVAAQTAALRDRLDGAAPRRWPTDEAALWREYAGAHRAEPGQSTAFAGTLPGRLTAVAEALAGAADAAEVDVSLASYSALGLHTARFSGRRRNRRRRSTVAPRGPGPRRHRAAGGTPAEIDAAVDALGPAPSTVSPACPQSPAGSRRPLRPRPPGPVAVTDPTHGVSPMTSNRIAATATRAKSIVGGPAPTRGAHAWQHRHLRRAPPAGRRADLRLRALRLLPRPPAPPTRCGARRWTPRAGGST